MGTPAEEAAAPTQEVAELERPCFGREYLRKGWSQALRGPFSAASLLSPRSQSHSAGGRLSRNQVTYSC